MKVLVTGASGYLGGWVCEYLKRRGYTILQVGRAFKELGSIECDPRVLGAVVHLGWRSKAGSSEPDLQIRSLDNTVSLVRQLTSRECPNTCKLVFVSTCSVYGPITTHSLYAIPFKETDRPLPNCSYTWAKVAAEEYIKCFMKERSIVFRLGSLMGRGVVDYVGIKATTKLDLVVNAFANDGFRRGVIECWSPDSWKPLLHVKDAARLIVEGIERQDMLGTYNAASCCMQARSIAQLAAHLSKAEVRFVDPPSSSSSQRESPRSARVDTSKLDRELGGFSYRTVEEAIREFS